MKKIILAFCSLVAISLQVHATYTGRVFVDKNKNGIMDKGEKPMAGVAVSDGLHVVRTTAEGLFKLPGHEKERFIFITTPSGYKTDNRHYIRISHSSTSYNFGLQPYEDRIQKDGSHTYIHITDTEIFNTTQHEDWIKDIRQYAANEKAAFIVHTGDICYEKGLKEHINLMNTANMQCPVFYCIGNHDLVKGNYGEELYESIYGPVFYSFEVGNVHYIVTPMLGGDHKPSYTKADVYRWLKNDLALVSKNKPIVVFNHDLLTQDEKFIYGISDTEQIDLNTYNLKAWIYGHWHINYMKKQGNVYTLCTGTPDKGGIDHSTSAFRVIHTDQKGNISSQLRYTYIDKHIEIASPGEDGFPVLFSGAVPLTVNTYHSASPTREVTYTCLVDGKKLFANRKLTQKTDWSWTDRIYLTHRPVGKTITVQVTAVFNNGEKAEKEVHFPYKNKKPQIKLKEDWNNLLGNPAHTGNATANLEPPLQMAWTSNVGANIYMSSPLVYKDKILVASVDEDLKGKSHIYALNSQTGDLLWKYGVNNSIKNTIVAEDDLVFAQTAQGSLYAVNTQDGSLKWGVQLHVNGLPALIEGLVVHEGIVYAGTGKGLCALNARTGEMIWENKDWGQGEGTTSTLSLGKGLLIGSVQWRGLYANEAATGSMKWQLTQKGLNNRGASAAIHGNLLYVTSIKSLFIIETEKGNIIVKKEYPFSVDVTSTPLLTDKEIIFGTATSGLVAVDRETLDVKWQYETEEALIYTAPYTRSKAASIETSPIWAGKTVYFGASDGTLYGINKEDGALMWKQATGAPLFGSVSASGNALFAVDFGGNVYAFTTNE
ncbi:hypothetical protein D0T51_00970 [Parabacteroides sp. 52]|uniref:outer membrane protein assembly factor BamB family protein n=1 Tax=unclassified Parabacteroides TaxID=2649774 RepID=UPI0013D4E595|nr:MULTISPECIES: PQQ-binding-like beta-propeller repeat protein [unclassified Parabacteroides]MDH6533556.1 outer membrane protein assembly factor BamB/predicted phosphodiesterase [Parabacteroides sp. PM5-20]NDV54308.1 hypothetical protein [Parabacteroides sp. 52]